MTKLQCKLQALQNRLDRYISKAVKATKAMILDLIFAISKLERMIEVLAEKTEPKQMTIFDVLEAKPKQKLSVNKNISIKERTNANGVKGFEMIFSTPFNQAFIDEFKGLVKSSQRGWDNFNKVWRVFCFTKSEVKVITDVMNKHFQLTK